MTGTSIEPGLSFLFALYSNVVRLSSNAYVPLDLYVDLYLYVFDL